MDISKSALRPVWRFLTYNWKFGLFLVLLLGIPRFILVMQANVSGGYGTVSFIFLAMWVIPFILLSKEGRRYIGIKKPVNYSWLLYSFFIGIGVCVLMYICADFLYGNAISNSFVYISKSYLVSPEMLETNRFMFFVIFSLSGMTFSPIGEELFYRGVVHGSFVERFGETKASVFDSLAFALTHLAHFGIIFYLGKWSFLPVPALLWMLGMFVLSQLLFLCKQRSGSILGAIIGHAGYNVGMMYVIFYHIF